MSPNGRKTDEDAGGQQDASAEPSIVLSWRSSPQRIRSITRFGVMAVTGGVAMYLAVILFVLGNRPLSGGRQILGVTLALFGVALFLLAVYQRQMNRARYYEEREQEAKEGEDEAFGEFRDVADLAALIRFNRRQVERYEVLTRRQASSSYRLSQGALAVGLVLLAGGSVAALATPESSSKAIVAVLTAIGSALAGFIANTYLRVYERTLIQLNYYFQQPLVTGYVLTAERLAAKIEGTQRDEAQREIISRVLANVAPSPERGPMTKAQARDASNDRGALRKLLRPGFRDGEAAPGEPLAGDADRASVRRSPGGDVL
jgi:hypothetical protein